ncbi:MAG: hypothetical protein FWB88_05995 [Defluviitaleaceae bacterium]|nr:hypothetical protein [Defluviitaleaceae bacterium]MCL2240142.1 hypothetical protein [Defluviitaleaceae bacterium]
MKSNFPMICPHESLMRMVRNSSELRQYYLEKERQAIKNDTSFKDALQAFADSEKSTDGIAIKSDYSSSTGSDYSTTSSCN